ncbi:MAG: inositol monophosphatase [Deltaproteobacteria bacterium]|nr:inositol monophosphatase [Deltaproteobacteria bacterium]
MAFPTPTELDTRLLPTLHETLESEGTAQWSMKPDGSPVTELDHALQEAIIGVLRQVTPEYPVLGEEMDAEEQSRIFADATTPFWVLDPLDGTGNYTAGIPFYCTALALIESRVARLGWVYDPNRRERFVAVRGKGAWLGEQRLHPKPVPPLAQQTIQADLKRLPEALRLAFVQNPPYRSQRNFGASALEWCWVAAGRGHFYLHGRQQLWDYAAGQLILREAGGHCCQLNGEPLEPLALGMKSVQGGEVAAYAEWREWLKPWFETSD